MAMIKRATCSSKMVVSETVYSCPKCGYATILDDQTRLSEDCRACPDCEDTMMDIMSSSYSMADDEIVDASEDEESSDYDG